VYTNKNKKPKETLSTEQLEGLETVKKGTVYQI